MKLYTEEEVVDLANRITGESTESILSGLTPIELPSDEEIEDAWYEALHSLPSEQIGFILGAEWVINQIKQQSNGN